MIVGKPIKLGTGDVNLRMDAGTATTVDTDEPEPDLEDDTEPDRVSETAD